ncbi:MAG: hypothetical protein H0U74_03635 [Bradymonadaceae bacterium]|nr:hypothetical protein [Lujinxingiaceae bacterium]
MRSISSVLRRTPRKWWWFAAYCFANAGLFLALVVYAIYFMFNPALQLRIGTEMVFMGPAEIIALSLPLAIAFGVGPLLARKDWAWRYNVGLLCFGIASFYALPFAIAVLAMWVGNDMKRLYHHEAADPTPLPQAL